MNIVLIGMPGSGKSTLGMSAARGLGMEFLDTDVLIEQHEKRPITEIFKTDGEAYFRGLETAVIETVLKIANADAGKGDAKHSAKKRSLMLSVGGGAAEASGNAALLRRIGAIVFIDRPIEALERNIVYNGKRPLLSDREKLVELYERRRPIYEKLSDRIVANDGGFEDAAGELTRVAKLLGAESDYLVIGDPIAHTLSPRLHGAIFAALRAADVRGASGALADATYGAARVPVETLGTSVADMRCGSVRGMNVTIPHKKAITPFLDEIRGVAVVAGAVNTVVKEGDRLLGYNTDADGLALAIGSHGRSYAGSNVVVCGTGGAASGVVAGAASGGASNISIIGRNGERAAELVKIAETECAGRARFIRHDFTDESVSPELANALEEANIFINATPLGMAESGSDFNGFFFLDKLPATSFVYDLVYKPRETALVKAARERGLDADCGLSMLIYQAILSDELFGGIETDREALYGAALRAL
jgi:shikimate dehydrogenase